MGERRIYLSELARAQRHIHFIKGNCFTKFEPGSDTDSQRYLEHSESLAVITV